METLFEGGFAAVAERLAAWGARRVLVLCGPNRRFVDGLVAVARGVAIDVFDGARVHVPAEIVEAATARMQGVDAIVAIGGGSTVGLGKALRLTHDVRFIAVPTTYAGSEMTTMYGVTRGRDKQTGRDPRVRPDLVVYDAALARDLPIALTAQSLLNAVAHVASVLPSLDDLARADALAAAHDTLRALEDLLGFPRAIVARTAAARGASACATAFDRGKAGVQHALAHLLGGALGVDHAALHAILLPQFLAFLRATAPETLAALEAAVDRADLDAYVHDLIVRAGAPVALTALGPAGTPGTPDAPDRIDAALATRPDLPASIVRDARTGLRPPGRGGRIDLAGAEALVLGPRPDDAACIVLALHGRGAEAGTIARRFREIAAHDPSTCVIGLRADGNADRWYAIRANLPGAGGDAEVARAIARVDGARRALAAMNPRARLVVAGFSQGACLAVEYAARHGVGLAAVIAPCGARIGRPDEWAPALATEAVQRLPILVGAAFADPWMPRADHDATVAWLRAAGALVDDVSGPGDKHEITLRQRLRARELVAGRAHPDGVPGALESAARDGAVPAMQNSPRLAPFGLYPEQVSGTGFTAPRAGNARTWLYRVRPSTQRSASVPRAHARLCAAFAEPAQVPALDLVAFAPLAPPPPEAALDFVDGLTTLMGAGDARLRRGFALHRYACGRSMNHRAFASADGDLVILPVDGALTIATELGPLEVAPGALAVIPRGLPCSILLHGAHATGYVAEPFGRHVTLPERGPVGANGLADPRHLRPPHAWFEDRLAPGFVVTTKLGGALHDARQDHSPFDVVGWHGTYLPFTYDLAAFSPVGNTAFDHGDPSIGTVLSAPLDEQGASTLDLVVFPPRWDVAAHTFRPPYFHRNAVTEINGIIRERAPGPFVPGLVFLTPPTTPHGISGRAIEHARKLADADADRPRPHDGSLWFQLETALAPVVTPWSTPLDDWAATWGSHRSYFA